ncbi:tripartite tricarboxylate transporter substrate-binding protein [Variovorax defluvii]|uniref:Tripartite tricarboxylate transporter substrate-binding protein n=1 Tax=Variovorax defluvii TaxID=913761 RepID=A0ABP8HG43_9BURK
MKHAHFIRAAALTTLAGLASAFAIAQGTQPVRLIVGFPAGGSVDTIARAFAEQARVQLGTTMVVENRAGASGKIAIDAMMSAPADAATVLIAPASVIELGPMVLNTMKFDAIKDFAPIGRLAEYGFGVAAGAASGAKDIDAYKAWARANPSLSSFATPGLGTPQQFLGVQLQKTLGVELVHVPYKGGANSVTDVMGGQVPLLVTTEQVLVPYHGQGKLNTLFITSKRRNALMPDVPTAKEIGMPQLESVDWFGAFVKAGTPADKLSTWRANVQRVVASQGYKDEMKKLGYDVPNGQPADLAALMTAERNAWAERVKLSGFKPTE